MWHKKMVWKMLKFSDFINLFSPSGNPLLIHRKNSLRTLEKGFIVWLDASVFLMLFLFL